jgi:hypothetical protein
MEIVSWESSHLKPAMPVVPLVTVADVVVVAAGVSVVDGEVVADSTLMSMVISMTLTSVAAVKL